MESDDKIEITQELRLAREQVQNTVRLVEYTDLNRRYCCPIQITPKSRIIKCLFIFQHSELLDARRKLLRCEQKEHDYLEELKEAHALLTNKEEDCTRLAKDLGASQVREAQAEAKCVQEARRVEQQYSMKVNNLESEVNLLVYCRKH